MYQISETGGIIRLSDGACIPRSEANIDYQDFLAWMEGQNLSLPPEMPLPSTSARWADFYGALLLSVSFGFARTIASSDLAVQLSYTDLATALSMAALGSANVPAVQEGYNSLKATLEAADSPLSEEHLAELQGLFDLYNIPLN